MYYRFPKARINDFEKFCCKEGILWGIHVLTQLKDYTMYNVSYDGTGAYDF